MQASLRVDTVQQQLCHGGHARFGIAHGRSVIAINVAEIALTVDQGISHDPGLWLPRERSSIRWERLLLQSWTSLHRYGWVKHFQRNHMKTMFEIKQTKKHGLDSNVSIFTNHYYSLVWIITWISDPISGRIGIASLQYPKGQISYDNTFNGFHSSLNLSFFSK